MQADSKSSPITVKFQANTKIGGVADPDSSRYALGAVQVSPRIDKPGQVWLSATDGRCLAVVKAEGEAAARELCPAAIIPAPARKPVDITLNGRWETTKGKFADKVEGRFPRVADCFPDTSHLAQGEQVAVHLDARLLAKVQNALNTDNMGGVTLIFRLGKQGPISVVGELGIGVVMPLTCGECETHQQIALEQSKRFEAVAAEYRADHK